MDRNSLKAVLQTMALPLLGSNNNQSRLVRHAVDVNSWMMSSEMVTSRAVPLTGHLWLGMIMPTRL